MKMINMLMMSTIYFINRIRVWPEMKISKMIMMITIIIKIDFMIIMSLKNQKIMMIFKEISFMKVIINSNQQF